MSTENSRSKIKEKISEIEEKSVNADHIYRGEPECYERVSSSIWRQFSKKIEDEQFDIEVVDIDFVQDKILDAAENYARGSDAGFEMMSQLQHYGGKTNLIDFTTDYLRALFFRLRRLPSQGRKDYLVAKNRRDNQKIPSRGTSESTESRYRPEEYLRTTAQRLH